MTGADLESSIGDKCKYHPAGLTCYEAIGAVLTAFIAVAPSIMVVLNDNKEDLEAGLPTNFSVALEVFMVAKSKSRIFISRNLPDDQARKEAHPTIAIISSNKTYRKRALLLLKKHETVGNLKTFTLLAFDKDPAILMAPSSPIDKRINDTEDNVSKTPAFDIQGVKLVVDVGQTRRRFEGIQLLFSTNKFATLGGILSINGEHHVMTVNHARFEDEVSVRLEDEASDFSDDHIFGKSPNPQTRNTSTFYNRLTDRVLDSIYARLGASPNISRKGAKFSGQLWNYSATSLSHRAGWLDSKDLDYFLFKPTDVLIINETVLQDVELVTELPEEEDVFIEAGTGTARGKFLSRPYFLKLPGIKTNFQQVWAVELERKSRSGDCGAWVMSRSSGRLYGHVVAGDPYSKLAYIIPAFKVLEDLKDQSDLQSDILFLSTEPYIRFSRLDVPEFRYFSAAAIDSAQTSLPKRNPIASFIQHYLTYTSRSIAKTLRELQNTRAAGGQPVSPRAFKAFAHEVHQLILCNIVLLLLAARQYNIQPKVGAINLLLSGVLIGSTVIRWLAELGSRRYAYILITIALTYGLPFALFFKPVGGSLAQELGIWVALIGIGIGGHYSLRGSIIHNIPHLACEIHWSDHRELLNTSFGLYLATLVVKIGVRIIWRNSTATWLLADVSSSIKWSMLWLTARSAFFTIGSLLVTNPIPRSPKHRRPDPIANHEIPHYFFLGFAAWALGSCLLKVCLSLWNYSQLYFTVLMPPSTEPDLLSIFCSIVGSIRQDFWNLVQPHTWIITLLFVVISITVTGGIIAAIAIAANLGTIVTLRYITQFMLVTTGAATLCLKTFQWRALGGLDIVVTLFLHVAYHTNMFNFGEVSKIINDGSAIMSATFGFAIAQWLNYPLGGTSRTLEAILLISTYGLFISVLAHIFQERKTSQNVNWSRWRGPSTLSRHRQGNPTPMFRSASPISDETIRFGSSSKSNTRTPDSSLFSREGAASRFKVQGEKKSPQSSDTGGGN